MPETTPDSSAGTAAAAADPAIAADPAGPADPTSTAEPDPGRGAAAGAGVAAEPHRGSAPSSTAQLGPVATSLIGVADLVIDLIVLAVAGAILGGLISAGASLVVILGLGLLVLALIPWFLRGYSIVERHRTGAVYCVDIPALPRRRTPRTGFAGVLHQWWLDASDSTPWRALAHLIVSTVVSWVFATIALLGTGVGIGVLVASATGSLAADAERAPDWTALVPDWAVVVIGVGLLVLGLIAALAYGPLDRSLSRGILGASRAAILQRRVDAVNEQRTSAVAAAEHQRTSIERDLHDGVQPRLVSVAMTLGMAKSKLDSDPAEARELIETAHTETKDAITELRRLARGLHPAVLEDRGLDAALSAIVARSPVPVTLDVDLPTRCSSQAEAVVYFAVSEAIANIAKHARASRCSVRVDRVGDRVVATVTDDGIGGAVVGAAGAPAISAGGLAGIRDRAVAAGGSLRVSSPIGGPTVITVEVPCAS